MYIIAFMIAFLASIIGGICGVGGGVLMKPVLDMTGIASVSAASFLSGATVLAMTGYNTVKNLRSNDKSIDYGSMVPMALGAAIGGIAGKLIFDVIKASLSNADRIGGVQAVVLALISLATALYTIKKHGIKTLHVENRLFSAFIGFMLGVMSSFLGIGGGPINLVVLSFFFSMESIAAVQSSLFIILISQIFSFGYTFASGKVPQIDLLVLLIMICGGIGGGIIGKKICKKIDNRTVDRLFIGLLAVIVLICIYNTMKYFG